MSGLDDSLTSFLPRQVGAEVAIHGGELAPRLALSSQHDPVRCSGPGARATADGTR
jgi:hypothetical protein